MGLYTFIKDEVYLPSDPDTSYKLQIIVDRIKDDCSGFLWRVTYGLMDSQGKVQAAGTCDINMLSRDIRSLTFSSIELFKEVLKHIDRLYLRDNEIKLAEEKALAELKTWDGRI